MPQKSLVLNVSVCLPKEMLGKVAEVGAVFGAYDTMFSLDEKAHFPHVTLYMAEFPRKNIPHIIRALDEITPRLNPIVMKATLCTLDVNGYLGINFRKTPGIALLQGKIVWALNAFREGLVLDTEGMQLTAAQQANLRQYGYDAVDREFRPHMTLTRFREVPAELDTREFFRGKDFSFIAYKLQLFRVGTHFTCRERIASFDL